MFVHGVTLPALVSVLERGLEREPARGLGLEKGYEGLKSPV